MCTNEFYSDTLKYPQMNLTEVKTIANNANNSGSNGFDGDNEENEDTNGDYVNGGKDQYFLNLQFSSLSLSVCQLFSSFTWYKKNCNLFFDTFLSHWKICK